MNFHIYSSFSLKQLFVLNPHRYYVSRYLKQQFLVYQRDVQLQPSDSEGDADKGDVQQEQPQPQALPPSAVDSQATLPYSISGDATPLVIDDSVDQGRHPLCRRST